jgi:hypothetical protein
MKKSILLLVVGLVLMLPSLARAANGDVTTVNLYFADDPNIFLTDSTGAALTDGISGDGNGAVLQLGYYTDGTRGAHFGAGSGTWIALTGEGGVNSAYNTGTGKTSIGDSGYTDGQVSLTLGFTVGDITDSSQTGNNLPTSSSIPLVLRFYNNTTISSSSKYNEVSADSWTWLTPTGAPGSSMTLTGYDADLVWLGGTGTEFKTTIINPAAIPEPSTYALLGMGVLGLVAYRRRK